MALVQIADRTKRITAALVLCACAVAAVAQSDSPPFVKFKREMMPKVGQKITVVGIWRDETKICCWLEFNKWGAYVYAAKESGIAREKDLFAHFHNGQTVKVTGILKYFPKRAATRNDLQYPPEHFFFDTAEVEMSRWSPSNHSPSQGARW